MPAVLENGRLIDDARQVDQRAIGRLARVCGGKRPFPDLHEYDVGGNNRNGNRDQQQDRDPLLAPEHT